MYSVIIRLLPLCRFKLWLHLWDRLPICRVPWLPSPKVAAQFSYVMLFSYSNCSSFAYNCIPYMRMNTISREKHPHRALPIWKNLTTNCWSCTAQWLRLKHNPWWYIKSLTILMVCHGGVKNSKLWETDNRGKLLAIRYIICVHDQPNTFVYYHYQEDKHKIQ